MVAKDGGLGFDFAAIFDVSEPQRTLPITPEDGRKVETIFAREAEATMATILFDADGQNVPEMQRAG